MYFKLKYLYFLSCLACAGALLSACSSDIPEKSGNKKGTEVSFAVPDQSRATITTSIDRFSVYGDIKFAKDEVTAPQVIFNKTEVVKAGNGWGYQGTQYWFPKHEHSFVAVYPNSVLDAAQYADSRLSFTYTLPNSNDDAIDIISATHRRLYSEGDAVTPVSLHFGHLLSMLNFSLELTGPSSRSEEFIKIQKLEMTGFGNSATINIKPASRLDNTQTDDSEVNIVTAKGNGSLEISFDPPIVVDKGATAIRMFDADNAIIMLPQAFAADEKVQILLTYVASDETEPTEVSASLSDFKWESGKSYNYNVKLEVKKTSMVISGASIVPWTLIDDHDEVKAI